MCTHSLFVFGLGYSTTGIARQAQSRHTNVTSTCRTPQKFSALNSNSHRLVLFDPAAKQTLNADALHALQHATFVVSSIPPVAATLYDPILQAQHKLLRQVTSSPSCCISGLAYLSSTGVYGDWQGGWVDERSEPHTATGRGLIRLEAEAAWAALADQLQLPITIFRLGGIYGPMRSVLHSFQTQARTSSSAARRGRQRYTSRCHVADVAQAVLADLQRRATQQQQQQQQQDHGEAFTWPGLNVSSRFVDIVNVVDDEPAPRGDVEAYALQLLGLEVQDARLPHSSAGAAAPHIGPASSNSGSSSSGSGTAQVHRPAIDAQPLRQQSPSGEGEQAVTTGRQRSSARDELEEKRVRNDKLKQVLGVQLLAPTYREGLSRMHAGDSTPFAVQDLECLFTAQ